MSKYPWSRSSYVPTPPDSTRPRHPNLGLLHSIDEQKTALNKYQQAWYRKMLARTMARTGLDSKAKKNSDYAALAIGYGHLGLALECTMEPRISLTDYTKDHEGIQKHLGQVDLSRDDFDKRPTVRSDVAKEVRIFDIYRDKVFSAAVTYLLEDEKGGNEITPCLQKARDFCTLGSGFRGTSAWTDYSGKHHKRRLRILEDPGCPEPSDTPGDGSIVTDEFDHSQCVMSLHDRISAVTNDE